MHPFPAPKKVTIMFSLLSISQQHAVQIIDKLRAFIIMD